jgi:hypothetical protein
VAQLDCAARQRFLLAWLAVAGEGNHVAARMDFRAVLPNILQLFRQNTRTIFHISRTFPSNPAQR